MSNTLVLRPRVSEKAYGMSQSSSTYVFVVPTGANKHEVADAVAAQFNVIVKSVNLMNVAGKTKRTVRKGGRPANGRTAASKKAYVTLAEGNSISLFPKEEAEEAKVAKADKADKKGKK